MGSGMLNTQAKSAEFFVLVLSIPISIAATALRFVATHKGGRKPGVEDWLALGALVALLVSAALQLAALVEVGGANAAMAAIEAPQLYAHVMKLAFAAQEFWALQQTLSKLSILALYRRIFGVSRANAIAIWVIGFVQVAQLFICIFMQAFACNPVKKFWEPLVPGTCMTKLVLIVAEPINSAVDFALVVLAIFMIRPLQLSSSSKWKLGFLFGLGGLAGVIGFLKIGMSYSLSVSDSYFVLSMWSSLQSLVGIVCCCAPVYKPILPETGVWKHLVSSWSSIGSSRRRHSGDGKYLSDDSSMERKSSSSRSSQPNGRSGRPWLSLGGGSSRGLVSTDTQRGFARDVEAAFPPESNSAPNPVGAIHVHRSVDVE